MRRAVHGLLAVAMLTGMSLVLVGALAAVLLDMSDMRGVGCELWRADLYRTSNATAYMAVSAVSLGQNPASALISFADDDGIEHNMSLDGSWKARGPLNATITAGQEYLVRASFFGHDGSTSMCWRVAHSG